MFLMIYIYWISFYPELAQECARADGRISARSLDSEDKAQRGTYKGDRYSRYGTSLVNKSFIAQLKLHELDFLYSN